jgi:uncharacterized SAM-binding protein YcdF (DUF218 family)
MDPLMKPMYKFFAGVIVFWGGICGLFILYVVFHENQHDTPCDHVVVLTGGPRRITHALHSIESHEPKSIFISGVYEKTTLSDVLQNRHRKDVKIILGRQAKNTKENALEIDKWVRENNISEILLITSDYHIIRSILELKHVNDTLKIYSIEVKSDLNFKFIWQCIKEFHKIVYVCIRNFIEKLESLICWQ